MARAEKNATKTAGDIVADCYDGKISVKEANAAITREMNRHYAKKDRQWRKQLDAMPVPKPRRHIPTDFVNLAALDSEKLLAWRQRLNSHEAEHFLLGTPRTEVPADGKIRILCVMPDVEAPFAVLDALDGEINRLEDALFYNESAEEQDRLRAEILLRKRARDCAEDKFSNRVLALGEASGFVVDAVPDVDHIHLSDLDSAAATLAPFDLVFIDANLKGCHLIARLCRRGCAVLVANLKQEKRVNGLRTVPSTLTALLRVVGDEINQRSQQLAMPWTQTLPAFPAPTAVDAHVDALIVQMTKEEHAVSSDSY